MNKITNLVLSILITVGICTSTSAQYGYDQGYYLPDLGKNYEVPNLGGGFYMPELGGKLNAPNIDAGYYLPNLGQGFNAPNLGDGFYLPELGKGFDIPQLDAGYLLPNIEGYAGDAFYLPELGKGLDLPAINDAYFLPDLGANFGKKDFGAGFFFPEIKNVVVQGQDGQDGVANNLGGFFMPDLGKGLDLPILGDGFYFPELADKFGGFLVPDLGGKLDIPNIKDGFVLPDLSQLLGGKLGGLLGDKNIDSGYLLPDLVSANVDGSGNVIESSMGDGLYIPKLGEIFCDKINLGDGIVLPDLGKNINLPAFDNSIFFPDLGGAFNLPEIGGGFLLEALANKISIPDLDQGFYFPEIGKGFDLPEVKDGFYFPNLDPIFAGGIAIGGNGQDGADGEDVVVKKNLGGGFYMPDLGKGFNIPQVGGGYYLPELGKNFNVPVDQGYYFPELGKGFNNADLGAGYYLADLGGAIEKPQYGDGFYFPQVDKAYDYNVGDAYYFQDLGQGFGYPEIGGGFYAPDFGQNYKGYNLGGGYQFPDLAYKGYGKKAPNFPDLGEGYYFQDENGGFFFPLDEIDNQAGKRGGGFKLPNLGKGYNIPKYNAYQVPNLGGKKFNLPQVGGGYNLPKVGGGYNLPQFGGGFDLPKIQNVVVQGQDGADGQSNVNSFGNIFGGDLGNIFGNDLFTNDKQFNFGDLFNIGDIFGGFDFSKFKNLLDIDLLGNAFEIPDFGKNIDLPKLGDGIFLPDFGKAIDLPSIGGKFDFPDLKGLNIPDFKNFDFPAFGLDKFDKFNLDFGQICGNVPATPQVVDGSGNPIVPVDSNPVIVEDPKFDLGVFANIIFELAGDIDFNQANGDLLLQMGGVNFGGNGQDGQDGADGQVVIAQSPAPVKYNYNKYVPQINVYDKKGQVAYQNVYKGGYGKKYRVGPIEDNYDYVNVDFEDGNQRARISRRIDTMEEEESNCTYSELTYAPQVNNIAESTALVSTSNLYTGVGIEMKESTSADWTAIPVTANGAALLSQLKGCTKYDIRNTYNCDNGKIESEITTFETEGCENMCGGAGVEVTKVGSFGSGIVLTWDVVPGYTYQLNYKTKSENNWKNYNTQIPFVVLFGLDACTEYEFSVNVICEVGRLSNDSNMLSVETGNCKTGSQLTEEGISIYPSIATNHIGIVNNGVENLTEVNLFDVAGNFVKAINPNEMNISINDLSSGVYVVTAKAGDKVLTNRFIKK